MTTGEWLLEDAALTGDWESAALALRAELRQATADRNALIASMELAWSLVPRADPADPLDAFASEQEPGSF